MRTSISLDTPGPYLKEFDISIDSDLILITGVNGSGKSQLINGIASGSVVINIDGKRIPNSRILKFDAHSFSVFNPTNNYSQRQDYYGHHHTFHSPEFSSQIQYYSLNRDLVNQIIANESGVLENEFSEELKMALESGNSPQVAQIIQQTKIKRYDHSISKALESFYEATASLKIAETFKRGGYSPVIPQQTLDIEEILNSILEILNLDYRVYGKDEYVKMLIDRKLRQIGVETTTSQSGEIAVGSDDNFSIRFENKRTGSIVGVEMLSSGERALLTIGSIIANDAQYDINHLPPLVIMLDEADAHLHPDYIRILIEMLRKEFITKYNFKVFLSTHSPITLSLSEIKEAVLIKRGLPEIVSDSVALSNLMSGINHIDILSRKNVYTFVESHNDARIYSAFYSILSKQIPYSYSPIFLPSSHSEGGGNCDLVKHLITSLPDERIFHGIIDWDLSNEPSGRLHVLAHGTRYSIENLLFDPLILTAFCISRGIQPTFIDSISEISTSDYLTDMRLMQKLSSQWAQGIINEPPEVMQNCQYFGGFSLDIDTKYIQSRGHEIENRVRGAMPQFRRYNQGLHEEILRFVRDYPAVTPIEIVNLMSQLLE